MEKPPFAILNKRAPVRSCVILNNTIASIFSETIQIKKKLPLPALILMLNLIRPPIKSLKTSFLHY